MTKAENVTIFNCHNDREDTGDHAKTPWIQTARVEEKHGKPIYSCAFNPYTPEGANPILLTVADRYAHVYECFLNSNNIKPIGAFQCTSETESLFASTWVYDTFDNLDPHQFAVAGNNGYIYVVEAITQKLVNKLYGHGGPINEIRTNPANSNLIATASKDRTARVYHIRNETCIFVLAGRDAHADQILSIDWSFDGSQLISSGMDHTIFVWNMKDAKVEDVLKTVCEKCACITRNTLKVQVDDHVMNTRKPIRKSESESKNQKSTIELMDEVHDFAGDLEPDRNDVYLPLYFPNGKIADLHTDYVDCVRFFNESKYIFSKGCGKESVIYMSRLGTITKDKNDTIPKAHVETSSVRMLEKLIPNGETWFVKFDLDPLNRWITCGNNRGDVFFWSLSNFKGKLPDFQLDIGRIVIRQVVFSPCGRILIAALQDGSFVRLDRISDKITQIPSFKLSNRTVTAAPDKSDKKKAYTDMKCDDSDADDE